MTTTRRLTFGSLFDGIGAFSEGLRRAGMTLRWSVEIESECRRVTAARFPGVRQYEDVKDVGKANLESVDVLVGGSPCFPAGTLVLCEDGLKPIESVVVGDRVMTHLGKYHSVTAIMRRVAPTIRLRGQGHSDMVATENHPFWASEGRVLKYKPGKERQRGNWCDVSYSPPEWVEAKDMRGLYWSSPTHFPDAMVPPLEPVGRERMPCDVTTPGFFWMLGAWAGDGWTRCERRKNRNGEQYAGNVIICAGKHQRDALAAKLAASGLRFRCHEEKTTFRFTAGSAALCRWLHKNFGRYCHGKTIPAWLLGLPEELRRAFLDGYLFADGSRRRNGDYRASTVSKRLAVGVKLLAQSLGYSVSMDRRTPNRAAKIDGRDVVESEKWELSIFQRSRSSFVIGPHRFGLVRDVRGYSDGEEVFDLTVESAHSFLADGIIVHNCQGFSLAGKRGGMADERSCLLTEMVRVADEITPLWILWENVPGCFTSEKGEDFAAVLGAFSGYRPAVPDGGWCNSGVCVGPRRACAWTVLDCQHFGLAQRRKRIFLVCRAGDVRGLDLTQPRPDAGRVRRLPFDVLFVGSGMPWDTPPRRGERADAAGRVTSGTGGEGDAVSPLRGGGRRGYRVGAEEAAGGQIVTHDVAVCLQERDVKGQDSDCTKPLVIERLRDGQVTHGGGPGPVGAVTAKWAKGTGGPSGDECQNVVAYQCHGTNVGPAGTLRQGNGGVTGGVPFVVGPLTTGHTPNGHGMAGVNDQAVQSGHVVATPVIGVIQDCREIEKNQGGLGVSESSVYDTLDSLGQQGVIHKEPISFYSTGSGESTVGETPTVKVGTGVGAPASPAIAFHATQDPISGAVSPAMGGGNSQGCASIGVAYGIGSDAVDRSGEGKGGTPGERSGLNVQEDLQPTLRARSNNSVSHGMLVRRLTPTECLRLMGLPDSWQNVDPPLSNSTRYKQIGNAGAPIIVEYIGRRITHVEASHAGESVGPLPDLTDCVSPYFCYPYADGERAS